MRKNHLFFYIKKAFTPVFFTFLLLHTIKTITSSNVTTSFPIALGKIIIDDQMQAPFYTFKNIQLTPGITNILYDPSAPTAPTNLNETFFNLNLEQVELATQPLITIKPSLKENDFYSLTITYTALKEAQIISDRFLTITSSFPTNTFAECVIQFNIQNFLKKILTLEKVALYSNTHTINFKLLLINIRFDTYGNYLAIESVDIYINCIPISPTIRATSFLLKIPYWETGIWGDRNIFYSTCQSLPTAAKKRM